MTPVLTGAATTPPQAQSQRRCQFAGAVPVGRCGRYTGLTPAAYSQHYALSGDRGGPRLRGPDSSSNNTSASITQTCFNRIPVSHPAVGTEIWSVNSMTQRYSPGPTWHRDVGEAWHGDMVREWHGMDEIYFGRGMTGKCGPGEE